LARNKYTVEILDTMQVRGYYIDIPRHNASESRDEIISIQSKGKGGKLYLSGKVKG